MASEPFSVVRSLSQSGTPLFQAQGVPILQLVPGFVETTTEVPVLEWLASCSFGNDLVGFAPTSLPIAREASDHCLGIEQSWRAGRRQPDAHQYRKSPVRHGPGGWRPRRPRGRWPIRTEQRSRPHPVPPCLLPVNVRTIPSAPSLLAPSSSGSPEPSLTRTCRGPAARSGSTPGSPLRPSQTPLRFFLRLTPYGSLKTSGGSRILLATRR